MRDRLSSNWMKKGIFLLGLTVAVFAAFVVISSVDISTAMAQDPAPADAPAADDGGGSSNMLSKAIEALGWFYTVIFLSLSISLVALMVMNFLAVRRDAMVPPILIEAFEAHLNEKRYQEAYEMAKADESMLGQVLSAGLAKVSQGYDQSIEAMQDVGEEETMKVEHKLSYIALIRSVSPMIGLLGTVQGMIAAFDQLGSGQPDAGKLAGDISTALFTTFCGLCLAIPSIAIFTALRNRMQRLVLEVSILSEGLMGRFQPGGGAAAPGAGGAPKKPAPAAGAPQQPRQP